MIKELIIDIAYDKITVSQALTRAKLIANQLKNDIFKNWLNKELNGYEYLDEFLPEYRKIWAEIQLKAEFPYGQTHIFPVILPDDFDNETKDKVNFHRVLEPIAVIEKSIAEFEGSSASISLPAQMVKLIGELYKTKVQSQRGAIRSGWRNVGKNQYQNIVEQTKQKLLDTLQELENQFPQIDNNYIMNEENDKKVKTIITNNIYGNNNPLNLVAGENITQGNVSISINTEQKELLKSFGVEENEIEELRTIDKENPKGNESRKGKIMSWLSKVTASLAARGIYDKAPNLIEFISTIL